LANWGIFTAPQHPIILDVLKNIVESIRNEYHRTPSIYLLNREPRWLIVICITGPHMLTATIRAMAGERFIDPSKCLSIRVISNDFKKFGGSQWKQGISPHHYSLKLQNQSIYFLKSYLDFSIDRLEGKAISHGGRAIYFVENGTGHMFLNFQTFEANNFTVKDVMYIQNRTDFLSIPEGPILLEV
jgi:hypothetical protein